MHTGARAAAVWPWFLFAAGAVHWLAFLDFGDLPLDVYDWQDAAAYFHVLREAMTDGAVPFHISDKLSYTTRFLAIPGVAVSPQIALLPAMPTERFIVLDILLLYSAGFAGSLALKRAAGWGTAAFTVFFLLFNFNGFITAHLAVGHVAWAGYFLLPWFFLFAWKWARSGPEVPTAVALALVLFAIGLQGFLHLCVWGLAFVLLLAARPVANLKYGALTAAAWALLMSVRLAPGLVAYAETSRPFFGGYNSPGFLLAALTAIRSDAGEHFDPGTGGEGPSMAWWEYDMYIGWAGLAFLLYFGVWLRLRGGRKLEFRAFDLPVAVLAVLSAGRVYEVLYGGAFLSFERVTTRFLILPLLTLVVLGCVRLERWMADWRRWKPYAAWAGAGGIAAGLAAHSWTWAVRNLTREVATVRLPNPAPTIASAAAGPYEAAVIAGAGVSLVALVLAVWYVVRKRRTILRGLCP